jgi:hypothetical protein
VPTHPRRFGALLRAVYLVPRYSVIQSARLQDESLVRLLSTNLHGKVAMESHGRAESPRQFHARRMISGQLIKMQSAARRSGSAAYILHTSWRLVQDSGESPNTNMPVLQRQRGFMPEFFPTEQHAQEHILAHTSEDSAKTAQQLWKPEFMRVRRAAVLMELVANRHIVKVISSDCSNFDCVLSDTLDPLFPRLDLFHGS